MPEISARDSNVVSIGTARKSRAPSRTAIRMTTAQRAWLGRGVTQPGGKLPLFDALGQRISERTIKSCIRQGWAEPWFDNPVKPGWLVCRLTDEGRKAVQ